MLVLHANVDGDRWKVDQADEEIDEPRKEGHNPIDSETQNSKKCSSSCQVKRQLWELSSNCEEIHHCGFSLKGKGNVI